MNVVETVGLTHRYRRHVAALDQVELSVPEGAMYALLGRNGAGKSTLLRIIVGLQRATAGEVLLFGQPRSALTLRQRATIGYVAEGQQLPKWMTVSALEAYVAPLYDTWDHALADQLRDQFQLDPRQKIGTLSRGEYMKTAVLVSLAPRPRLLLMDEPFTGMDVIVKDELVRGLLAIAAGQGCTMVISSHDIAELESLCDWVGVLDGGSLRMSEPMDAMRERFRRVEVALPADAPVMTIPDEWMSPERAGSRLSFLIRDVGAGDELLSRQLPVGARIETRTASLREVFVAVASSPAGVPV